MTGCEYWSVDIRELDEAEMPVFEDDIEKGAAAAGPATAAVTRATAAIVRGDILCVVAVHVSVGEWKSEGWGERWRREQ
jgi:hypothetical protein